MRNLTAAEIAGIRALLVHALDDQAAAFYHKRSFTDSPITPVIQMLPLETTRQALR